MLSDYVIVGTVITIKLTKYMLQCKREIALVSTNLGFALV